MAQPKGLHCLSCTSRLFHSNTVLRCTLATQHLQQTSRAFLGLHLEGWPLQHNWEETQGKLAESLLVLVWDSLIGYRLREPDLDVSRPSQSRQLDFSPAIERLVKARIAKEQEAALSKGTPAILAGTCTGYARLRQCQRSGNLSTLFYCAGSPAHRRHLELTCPTSAAADDKVVVVQLLRSNSRKDFGL